MTTDVQFTTTRTAPVFQSRSNPAVTFTSEQVNARGPAGPSGATGSALVLAAERTITGADVLDYTDGVVGGVGDLALPPYGDSDQTQAFVISAFMGPITITPDAGDSLFDLTNTSAASVTVPDDAVVTLLHYAGVWRVVADSTAAAEVVATSGYGFASRERISAKAQPSNPVVAYDTAAWDSSEIREPGPAVYDPVTETWFLPYTAEGVDGTQIVAVVSTDGDTFTAHPDNPIGPFATAPEYGTPVFFDDPYPVKAFDGEQWTLWRDSLGRAHVYAEEKAGYTHVGIGRWVSAPNTLDGWTYSGRVLEPAGGVLPVTPVPSDVWDWTDRTSPCVIHDGERLIMLFEGRNLPSSARYDEWVTATAYAVGDIVWVDGPTLTFYRCVTAHTSATVPPGAEWEVYVGGLGMTGHAVSTDEGDPGTWTPHDTNPIILLGQPGSWNSTSVVIDDVIQVGDEWIALVHGADDDGFYTVGRYRTTDAPIDWNPDSFTECVGNPYDDATNTMMCWGDDPTQGVCIRQLESNPGVGERLERVWITPTVGVDGATFDPSGLQSQIDTLDGRADDVDTDLFTLDVRVDQHDLDIATANDLADAAAHFAADLGPGRILVTDAALDIYDLVGPGNSFDQLDPSSQLDPTLGPVVIVPANPTADTNRGIAFFAPTAPTAEAVLVGFRARGVEVSGDLGPSQSVTFGLTTGVVPAAQDGFILGPGADAWTVSPDGTGVVLPDGATAPTGPAYIALGAHEPIVGVTAILFDSDPGVSAFPTVTVQSAEWLWYIPHADLGALPTASIVTGVSRATEPGLFILDGATFDLPSAADHVGRLLAVQTTGVSDSTINPVPGEYVQNAYDGSTSSPWTWPGGVFALWRATSADELAGPAAGWLAVALSSEQTGGSGAVDSVNGETGVVVLDATDVGAIAASEKGASSGVAELDSGGKVPSAQLPSYVDDVVEVANFAALPGTGEAGKIYVTLDTNITYRWSGSAYVEISKSLALGETSATAYVGDRGKVAYDHSQVTGANPHATTAAQVGAVPVSLVDADSDLIVGTADNTVGRLAVPASRIVGRKASGSIEALTPAEVRDILGASYVVGGQDGGTRIDNTASETRVIDGTITLPALAPGELLLFRAAGQWFNNSGAIRACTLRIKVGATTLMTSYVGSLGSSTTARNVHLSGYIRANASGDGDGEVNVLTSAATDPGNTNGTEHTAHGTMTEAIQTAGLAFDVTVQHPTASTSLWFELQSLAIWKVPV